MTVDEQQVVYEVIRELRAIVDELKEMNGTLECLGMVLTDIKDALDEKTG